MIQFRQKEFWIGAAAGVAGLGLQMMGNSTMEEQGQQQMDEMKRHNAAMEKAAKQNPIQAGVAETRNYALFTTGIPFKKGFQALKNNPKGVWNNMKGLGKDVGGMLGSDAGVKWGTGLVAAGVGMGLAGYGANKVIQGSEKYIFNKDKEQKTYSIMSPQLTQTLKHKAGVMGSTIKKDALAPKGLLIGAGFTLLPYGLSKMSESKAANATVPQQQTTYSSIMSERLYFNPVGMAKGAWGAVKGAGKSIKTSYKENGLWGMTKNAGASTVGFFGGGMAGATKGGMKNLGAHMQETAKSDYGKRLGKWISDNPNTATLAAAVPGAAIGGAAWSMGQNAVEKPLRKIDKGAYAYQDKQNQEIQ